MKFERRLHNGKWAAYVRVLGIWWFIRDFDNAKKAGYFVSIAMGISCARAKRRKRPHPRSKRIPATVRTASAPTFL